MPKGSNQKMKLYRLYKIMLEKTDEEHSLSMQEIKDELERYEITADRRSLYDDFRALEVLGLHIEGEKRGRNYYYRVISKEFEIAELKLLVDAIQSSKFITEKKSRELIKKLENFVSVYEAAQLDRQVVVAGRIKTMNESIYYNVDAIHTAINQNNRIRFEYLKWDVNKKLVPRSEGLYEVSPWALSWDDENYYLVGFDSTSGTIKHYRVDKMRKINVTDEPREGKELFKKFDMATYAKKSFGMFGGEEKMVRLRFGNALVGVMIDRFGRDINIMPSKEEGYSETSVDVVVSGQFFGWIFALGSGASILSPKDVAEEYRNRAREIIQLG